MDSIDRLGGLAVQHWSQARATRDVDLTLLAGEPLLGRSAPRIVKLDWGYVEEHLVPLAELEEDPAILREFHRLRALASKR
jgi:hypothetical protein